MPTFEELRHDFEAAQVASVSLTKRINELRAKMDLMERQLRAPSPAQIQMPLDPPAPVTPTPPRPSMETRPVAPPPPRPQVRVRKRSDEMMVGQRWLLIAGVVITLCGLGYFLKYSFDQNWVGPWGRVAMAYMWGLMFLGIGEIARKKKFDTFGLYLIGGGIGVFYLATFSAFQVYHLIPQWFAFSMMILVTVFAGVLSLVYDKLGLAVLGLVGGFATPMLVSTGQANDVALLSYVAILNGGVIALSFFKRWKLLNILGFLFTWSLFGGYYFTASHVDSFWLPLAFANLFFLVYAVAPFLYYFLSTEAAQLSGFGITVPNAFLGLAFSAIIIRSRYSNYEVSAITVAYAMIFFSLARYLYARNPKNTKAIAMLLGKAILFLVITVPILFSGNVITVLWAAQAAVLMWCATKLKNRWLYTGANIVLGLALAKFYFFDWPWMHQFDMDTFRFNAESGLRRWITEAVVFGSLFQMARLAKRGDTFEMDGRGTSIGLFVIFGGGLFITLNAETVTLFNRIYPSATFASVSVLWTLFSVALISLGFARNVAALRKTAITLFAFTAFKVVFFDMADAATPFRVISFVVLGLMLIGASYLYYRFKDRIAPQPEKIDEAA